MKKKKKEINVNLKTLIYCLFSVQNTKILILAIRAFLHGFMKELAPDSPYNFKNLTC